MVKDNGQGMVKDNGQGVQIYEDDITHRQRVSFLKKAQGYQVFKPMVFNRKETGRRFPRAEEHNKRLST